MSTSAPVSDVALPAPVAKVPMLPVMMCCLVAGLLAAGGGGGAIYYLARSGKLPVSVRAVEEVKDKPEPKVELHRVALDPMLANLSDADGHSYVRLGVALGEAPEPGKKVEEGKPQPGADAAVRDVVLGVLGRHRSADLLVPDGKEQLKAELKEAFAKQTPEAHVQAVYFTEFLVQR